MSGRCGVPLRFFALVFALSVPLWGLGELADLAGVARPYNLPVSSLMGFCPLIAALLLLPRGERFALLKRAVAGFGPKRWYAPVLLLMPAIAVASYAALRLSGQAMSHRSVAHEPSPDHPGARSGAYRTSWANAEDSPIATSSAGCRGSEWISSSIR